MREIKNTSWQATELLRDKKQNAHIKLLRLSSKRKKKKKKKEINLTLEG